MRTASSFLLALLLVLCACTARKPAEKEATADDPWADYGLGQESQEHSSRPEDVARVEDAEGAEGPNSTGEELGGSGPEEPIERIDPGFEPRGATARGRDLCFEQLVELDTQLETHRVFSTVSLRGGMIRQDDYSDEGRTQPTKTQIHREGEVFDLDHPSRSYTSTSSLLDELNDPTTVFFFERLKGRNRWQELRREKVDGVDCTVYTKPAPAQLNQADELWVTDEPAGFLIRLRSKNLLGIETRMDRTLPEPADLEPSLFRAPTDYERR